MYNEAYFKYRAELIDPDVPVLEKVALLDKAVEDPRISRAQLEALWLCAYPFWEGRIPLNQGEGGAV